MGEHGASENDVSTTKLLRREIANLRRQLRVVKRQRDLLATVAESSSPDREGESRGD